MSGDTSAVVQLATVSTPILVAGLGVVGAVWAKRMSRKTEDATARKTNAEAVSIEVQTARGLVDEVKELMADQRTEYESRLATTRAEQSALADRVRATETRQQMLLTALVAHAPWDEAAWSALKTHEPSYPPPPPIGGGLFLGGQST